MYSLLPSPSSPHLGYRRHTAALSSQKQMPPFDLAEWGIDLFHQFVHPQGYGTPRQLGRGPTVIRIHHLVCRVFKRPPALRFARRPRSPNDAAYLKRQLIGLQILTGQSNQNGITRECPHLRYVHRRTDKEHRHSKGNCETIAGTKSRRFMTHLSSGCCYRPYALFISRRMPALPTPIGPTTNKNGPAHTGPLETQTLSCYTGYLHRERAASSATTTQLGCSCRMEAGQDGEMGPKHMSWTA